MPVETVGPPRSHTESQTRPTPPIENAIRDTLTTLGTKELPVFDRREEIVNLIRNNDRLIIEAETGSGKSTVTPVLALAELESRKNGGRVVVTQPRKVPAESLQRYLGETMGDRVGFRHGGGQNVTENTQLEFVTEGTLLNNIVRSITNDEKLLLKYDTVILDEVHERKVELDILMPLLKEIQAERNLINKPLKIILTSATMDRQKMLDYFDGAAHIEVEGRMFDVEEHFEEAPIELNDVMAKAAQKAAEIHREGVEKGDMLIFMPGQAEIEKTIDFLKRQEGLTENDEVEFISLIGGAESAETAKKIHEVSTKRRFFVSTDVAETSITIPSVRIVIDSGLMRKNIFDENTGVSGLETREHTQSNARQRKGRAGRTDTGWVHYLYTKEQLDSREPFLPAEILRTDLVTQVLMMKNMGISDITGFDFLDHPGIDKVNQAIQTLKKLGALNPDGTLNETGKRMAEINAEPRFARMIVEAERLGCIDAVALVAGMLQNTRYDVFDKKYRPNELIKDKYSDYVVPGSDILTRLNIWNEYVQHNGSKQERKQWEQDTNLKTFALFNAANTRREILRRRIPDEKIDLSSENVAKINQCVAVGLLGNDVIVRKEGKYQTLSGTTGIQIDNRTSTMSGTSPDIFLSGNLRRSANRIFAGFNMELSLDQIMAIAPYFELTPPVEEQETIEHEAIERENQHEHTSHTEHHENDHGTQDHQHESTNNHHNTHNAHNEHHASSHNGSHHAENTSKMKVFLQKVKDKVVAFLKKLKLIPNNSGGSHH